MTDRSRLVFRRNCIYCFKGGKQSKEHVFPRPLGYKLPVRMVCERCNNELGVLDRSLESDYWIRRHRGKVGHDPGKNPYLHVRKRADGKLELVEPYTDVLSWRAVGKVAFELLGFFIQESIFSRVFDDWRGFVREGKPDLADQGSPRRDMVRGQINPDKWKNRHIVSLRGTGKGCYLYVALFRSYEFFCFFDHPFPAKEVGLVLTVDLDLNEKVLWTRAEGDRVPKFLRQLR